MGFRLLLMSLTFSFLALLTVGASHVLARKERAIIDTVAISIENRDRIHLLDNQYLINLLDEFPRPYKHVPAGEVNASELEAYLYKSGLVLRTEIYKIEHMNRPKSSLLKIKVWQKEPAYHVIFSRSSVYLDHDLKVFPYVSGLAYRVPIVFGVTDSLRLEREVKPLLREMKKVPLTKRLCSDIHLTKTEGIIIYAKCFDFVIVVGEARSLRQKLRKLEHFLENAPPYEQLLNYREINLAFQNQIVCVRK